MSILFYRRPDYVSKSNGPLDRKECQRYVERTANGKRGIPDELSFENIIANKALPVCLSTPLGLSDTDRFRSHASFATSWTTLSM